jgi:hypothetical protein
MRDHPAGRRVWKAARPRVHEASQASDELLDATRFVTRLLNRRRDLAMRARRPVSRFDRAASVAA